MTLQLRTYTLKPGTLSQWTEIWREQIKPLREKLGFSVPGAWTVPRPLESHRRNLPPP